jgi:hypothetical protein
LGFSIKVPSRLFLATRRYVCIYVCVYVCFSSHYCSRFTLPISGHSSSSVLCRAKTLGSRRWFTVLVH